MKQWISSLAALLLPLCMVIGATWTIIWAINRDETGRQAKTWPTVPGVIINSHITAGSGKTSSTMRVQYRYVVGNAIIFGNRLNFGFPSPTLERRERFFSGARVPVYYKPSDPAVACLDPGEDAAQNFSAIAVSLFFFMFGFPLFLWHCVRIYSSGWKS